MGQGLWSLISSLFVMQVYSIRDAAANNLKRLAEEFGPEWAMQHIIPQVCLLYANWNCLFSCMVSRLETKVVHGVVEYIFSYNMKMMGSKVQE